jgi:hypothetical protein
MGYANFLSLTLVSKTKFSGDLLAVFMKWLCLVTPGAAEKRATVNTTISDAVFTELLEYYIKVYSKTSCFLKNIKGDLHPCANTPFNLECTAVSRHEAWHAHWNSDDFFSNRQFQLDNILWATGTNFVPQKVTSRRTATSLAKKFPHFCEYDVIRKLAYSINCISVRVGRRSITLNSGLVLPCRDFVIVLQRCRPVIPTDLYRTPHCSVRRGRGGLFAQWQNIVCSQIVESYELHKQVANLILVHMSHESMWQICEAD